MNEFDFFVENHLNLQVKISYPEHHGFLLKHGLENCRRVLDVGAGNGTFMARLVGDHPEIQFVGIDKRKQYVESCKKRNLEAYHVDMFARESAFDFSSFDGFLMRYFLLHVDHSQKILEFFKARARRPSKFWIIDLDWSQFSCEPKHETFVMLTRLIKDFCSKISVDSRGGQRVESMLLASGYRNIVVENIPFSTKTIPIEEMALYLKQEVQCYSRMSGRAFNDPETAEITRFIDEEFRTGKVQVSYGMVLVSAELT